MGRDPAPPAALNRLTPPSVRPEVSPGVAARGAGERRPSVLSGGEVGRPRHNPRTIWRAPRGV